MAGVRRVRILNATFIGAAFVILAFALFPGRFDGDSIAQYWDGQTLHFNDMHSVLVAALLGALARIAEGPGPMFVLQLAAYCGGLWLVTDALIEQGHRSVGGAISLLGAAPLLSFDLFEVQKDALLSALLLLLTGLALRAFLARRRLRPWEAVAAFCILVLALDSRQNAVFALLPLFLIARPLAALKWKPILVSLAVGLVVLAGAATVRSLITGPLLKSARSHLVYALIIYDLAGITARTGEDASHGLLPDFRANVARCYTPHHWDAFLNRNARPSCRPVGLAAKRLVADDASRGAFTALWLSEVAKHPRAYLAHRARDFGCLIRLGCYDVATMSPGFGQRPWDAPDMRHTGGAEALGAAATWLWAGPLGSGVVWIAVLLVELGVSAWRLPRAFAPLAFAGGVLSLAGLTYLASFAVFGVADELRYLHPVMLLALVAAPMTAASLSGAAQGAGLGQDAPAPRPTASA